MITVDDLVYTYDGTPAIDGVSMTVDDGEWLVIAGPNGSGKTTLVKHLNALLVPDEGEVRVDGITPAESPVAARTSVGMVFQNPQSQFVAGTVGADVAFGPENLGLERETIDSRVAAALEAVNLSGRSEDRIDTLSGGEQARLAIAGALAMDPSYLVLDEPFAGLDWPARQSVLEHLDTLASDGTGILTVTHDLRDLRDRADRIVGLEDGTVAVEGELSAVRDRLEALGVRVDQC